MNIFDSLDREAKRFAIPETAMPLKPSRRSVTIGLGGVALAQFAMALGHAVTWRR